MLQTVLYLVEIYKTVFDFSVCNNYPQSFLTKVVAICNLSPFEFYDILNIPKHDYLHIDKYFNAMARITLCMAQASK